MLELSKDYIAQIYVSYTFLYKNQYYLIISMFIIFMENLPRLF